MTAFRLALETAGSYQLPVLRRGPARGPLIVFAQPLFEEMNRCRRLIADIGAALADRGLASALPDLPGMGDHDDSGPFDLDKARAALTAFIAAQTMPVRLAAMRGGVFLLPENAPAFVIAPPARGDRLLTDLVRTHAAGERERSGGSFARADAETLWADGKSVRLAGYEVTPATAAALNAAAAATGPGTIAIGGGAGGAACPPVWRQADPVRALDAAAEIAARIAAELHESASVPT